MNFANVLQFQVPEIIESSNVPIKNEINEVTAIISALVVQTYAYYEIKPQSEIVGLIVEDILTIAPYINQNELVYAFKIGRIELGKNNMGKFSAETIKGWIKYYVEEKRKPYLEKKSIELEKKHEQIKSQDIFKNNGPIKIINEKGEVIEEIKNPFLHIAESILKNKAKNKDKEHQTYIASLNRKRHETYVNAIKELINEYKDEMESIAINPEKHKDYYKKREDIDQEHKWYIHIEFWNMIKKIFNN